MTISEEYVAYQDDSGEVLVLYRNGDLKDWWDAGDTEAVLSLLNALGIKLITTDDVLLGARAADVALGDSEPAGTIDDIEHWDRTKAERLERADELDRRADDLREQAARLRGEHPDEY